MLAEVLLVLLGHDSSFFVPSPPSPSSQLTTLTVSPHLAEYLHPGEVISLNSLGQLAFWYRAIKSWATLIQKRGREAVIAESLTSSKKGKGKERASARDTASGAEADEETVPNQYMCTLASSVLDTLSSYELLVVETEARILNFDPAVVQDPEQGYVPLSNLVATFDGWQAPLSSLHALTQQLSSSPLSREQEKSGEQERGWTPGGLLDLIYDKTQTGNPSLKKIYTRILSSLIRLLLTHLVSFLLYGIAPTRSTPTSPSIAIDVGSDPLSPKYRIYRLNDHLLPSSIDRRTRESILYIGRVAATLKREGMSLPKSLVDGVRVEIMAVKSLEEIGGLDDAIQRARAEVGEWLWKHILTGPQLAEAIESLANYFLTRKADFACSLLREITRLQLDKLVLSNPHSSSSVIREQDLDLALLRASVGTSAELDSALEGLRFRLERGPLRAIPPAPAAHKTVRSGTSGEGEGQDGSNEFRRLFSSSLLGTPLELTMSITWPLDLFLSPTALSSYADINAYLLAFRDTQIKVQQCWTSLTASRRQHRRWTEAEDDGSLAGQEGDDRKHLVRNAWGTVRIMGWWLDQMIGHFMDDIIDVQHRKLLEQLELVNMDGRVDHTGESIPGLLRGSVRENRTGTATPAPLGISSSTREGTKYTRAYTPSAIDGRPQSPLSETHTWGEGGTVRSNRAPPTPTKMVANYLDFLTLRQIHSTHLSFLREGLLISDVSLATILREILDTCKRFTALVLDRWGGDALPHLSEEGGRGGGASDAEDDGGRQETAVDGPVREREAALREINEELHDLLLEFFSALLDTQNPGSNTNNANTSTSADDLGDNRSLAGERPSFSRSRNANASRSRIQMSRMMSRQSSFFGRSMSNRGMGSGLGSRSGGGGMGVGSASVGEKSRDMLAESEGVLSRHVEQLLLRLDFNGVFTSWKQRQEGEDDGNDDAGNVPDRGQAGARRRLGSVLAEGGL
ncbi:hypothetical protein I316_03178 [Kwoniella heveanensis BCC8398]|uniref:Spindle pole body component n=1 Tax=Kwoniella heveanensis BCC8398 TaxID=1296120 RepID=A0A1B9GVR8_9TREE|nr:hypothetical protein I316_03178 [Kwoniella heveanensis BCC8398]